MKLVEDHSKVNVDVQGVKSHKMEIDASNTAILFSILSENLYSDVYGSIIRELVSNAWDANKESGNESMPVYVHFNGATEEESAHIKIVDNGPGISEDRVEKIYGKYLASSKRDSNDQIGGWGLGSKTPLAYTDYFHISTVHNGKQYLYIMRKGVTNTMLELMYSIPTDKLNGTEIKVYMKDNTDLVDFFKAALDQLEFFNNVILVANDSALERSYGYSSIRVGEIENFNKKKIFNFKNFVVVDQHNYGPPSILLGQVKYPLPKGVDLDKYSYPLAFKFNIGDLPVTPSREGILWTPQATQTFNLKVVNAIQEIHSLIEKQREQKIGFIEYYVSNANARILNITKDFNLNFGSYSESDLEEFYFEQTEKSISLKSSALCKYLKHGSKIVSDGTFDPIIKSLITTHSKTWINHRSMLRDMKGWEHWSTNKVLDTLLDKTSDSYRSLCSISPNTDLQRKVLVQNESILNNLSNRDSVVFLIKKFENFSNVKKAYKHFLTVYQLNKTHFVQDITKKQMFIELINELKVLTDGLFKYESLTYVKPKPVKRDKVDYEDLAYDSYKYEWSYSLNLKKETGKINLKDVIKKNYTVVKKSELNDLKWFFGYSRNSNKANTVIGIADSKFEKFKKQVKHMSRDQYDIRIANAVTINKFFSELNSYTVRNWINNFQNLKKMLWESAEVEQKLRCYADHYLSSNWYGSRLDDNLKDFKLNYNLNCMQSFYEEKGWINQDLLSKFESITAKFKTFSFLEFIKPEGLDQPIIKKMIREYILQDSNITKLEKIKLLKSIN